MDFLATLHAQLGEYEDSQKLYKALFDIQDRKLGLTKQPRSTRCNLAWVLAMQGKSDEAQPTLEAR